MRNAECSSSSIQHSSFIIHHLSMKVYRNIIEARNIPHAVVTIGTFDGVHLGHQAIFNKMKTLAQDIGGETVVVTFSPHPRQVLNIDSSNLRFLDMKLKYGCKVERVAAQDVENIAISSTKIRNALATGNVKRANQLLGYTYSVTAEVVVGNKIGRTLGFPTANLELPREYMLISNRGVYACLVDYEGKTYKAMANIGHRPTIGDRSEDNPIIEVNLFDFDGDLYGKQIHVRFIDRIRDEEKFDGLDALKAQLEQDREKAKQILA